MNLTEEETDQGWKSGSDYSWREKRLPIEIEYEGGITRRFECPACSEWQIRNRKIVRWRDAK